MYATQRFSELEGTAEAVLQLQPEAPNSGYVVVKDDNPNEEKGTSCWNRGRDPRVRDLPFPQNKIMKVQFIQSVGQTFVVHTEMVLFVPVINSPLSANRYYVVAAKGKHKGLAYTCSKEEDVTTKCFCRRIKELKPKPFDHRNIYQQMEIIPRKGRFTAKSVASDGFPPWIFRQKNWRLYEHNSDNYQLVDAFGLNNSVRSNFQKLDFGINVVVGKWYCPSIFVKEVHELEDRMEKTMFYEVTMEQFWQEAYTGIETKRFLLRGKEIMTKEMEWSDGFVWFSKTGDLKAEKIGLSFALWERVEWEEKREGWNEGASAMVQQVKVGSFVLVERFSFKRLDGSVALALDFIHIDKVRGK